VIGILLVAVGIHQWVRLHRVERMRAAADPRGA
jgi:hypothetical protein